MDEKDLHEHEHHHEHDHEHHHEHDHEHHHHDDECDCGCDHDHEHHHHDDECGCGHDHDHDEHECHDPNCTDPSHHHHHHDDEELVHISHHESSTIGALKGLIPTADYDEAEKQLAAAMREAGRLVTEAGGIIGHMEQYEAGKKFAEKFFKPGKVAAFSFYSGLPMTDAYARGIYETSRKIC